MPTIQHVSPLLLIGGGGHCHAIIDVLELAHHPIAGIVHGNQCKFEPVLGYPPLGLDEDLKQLRKIYSVAMVTVGQIKNSNIRQKLFIKLQELNFSLPVIISPLAYVSCHAQLDAGTVIMHQALINAGAIVGKNCIVNTRALVEHDCTIGNHCHIAVGATLCGGVTVGEGTFIGANVTVRENVKIGKGCVIGCGATITKNIDINSTVY